MNLLDELNPMQQKAVQNIDGPLLILAGAGSGKTKTIIHRIAYILQQTDTKPYQILALTFTNKAAGEMKERIRNFGIPDIDDMWMGTFHSICARILRMHADKIGFDRSFTIYDESDTKTLINKCADQLNLMDLEMNANAIKEIISKAKNNAMTAEDFYATYQDNPKYEAIAKIYESYQKNLKANNAMDFDDLLFHTINLFENNEDVLQYYQNRFRYVLVDEYQDTNRLQYEIVHMISRKHQNICVCGDDDQSIYGWRGADIRNILEFEKDYADAAVIRLEQNYRSSANILKAANIVIENNLNRKGKELWTEHPQGDPIQLNSVYRDLEESELIAKEIEQLVDQGRNYGEIAILYRINAQSRILEESLLRRGIPYQIVGGTRFYDRMEIKDILSYLKFSINPKDSIAFARAISSPKRGIGAATIEKLAEYAEFKGYDLLQASASATNIPTISSNAKQRLEQFAQLIQDIYTISTEESLHDAVWKAVKDSGYIEMLESGKLDNKESRIENLHELVNAAEEFEETSEDSSLDAFVENASLVAGTDMMNDAGSQVLLMTMHNSKGLEFNIVFLPGMEEGIFPLNRSISNPSELEEERRLCYVAITRAREKLYLSNSEYRRMYGSNDYRRPSRFLDEIPSELIEWKQQKRTEQQDTTTASMKKPTFYGQKPKTLQQKKKDTKMSTDFVAGDKIKHPSWGQGTIVSMETSGDDQIVTAAFAGLGVKKFILGYAKITKTE